MIDKRRGGRKEEKHHGAATAIPMKDLSELSPKKQHLPLSPRACNCHDHISQAGSCLPRAEISILCQCQVHHSP